VSTPQHHQQQQQQQRRAIFYREMKERAAIKRLTVYTSYAVRNFVESQKKTKKKIRRKSWKVSG
jgi:hypothetical protein